MRSKARRVAGEFVDSNPERNKWHHPVRCPGIPGFPRIIIKISIHLMFITRVDKVDFLKKYDRYDDKDNKYRLIFNILHKFRLIKYNISYITRIKKKN